MSVSITIKPQGKPSSRTKSLPTTLTFDEPKTIQTITVADVKAALQEKAPKLSINRQKVSLPDSKAGLADEKTIAEVLFDQGKGGTVEATPNGSAAPTQEIVLTVKDLGPQVGWRTVFFIEYAGPLVIHPLIYHFPKLFYGREFAHSELQRVTYTLVMLHFLKREFESLFIHRFSHATMPFRNIFKNSAHYHILSGFLLAGPIYGPWASAGTRPASVDDKTWIAGWVAVWAIAQLVNFQSHVTLRNLRPAGTRTRGIPTGGLFSLVSCPNYFAEMWAWIAVTAISRSAFAALFLVVSTVQMASWALKKHKAYRREFGDKYPRRKVMIPFIW